MRKERILEYFDFNRSQRRGILALSILMIALLGWTYCLPILFDRPITDATAIRKAADSLRSVVDEAVYHSYIKDKNPPDEKETTSALFPFDPNSLDESGWQRLGFSVKQAQSVLRYRNAGGHFNIRSDVSRLFIVSAEKYHELYPFILLPDSVPRPDLEKNQERPSPSAEPLFVDLNTADTTALKKLKGIGSYFARKIIEYREKLGGYVSVDQVSEIWNMKAETVEAIRPFVNVDAAAIRALDINAVGAEGLAEHPYITPTQARAVVNYRDKHGSFVTADEVKRACLMTDETYRKFRPYLRSLPDETNTTDEH